MTYSYQVPLSYTINVSLAATPSGLAGFNTNSIAIFSNETAGFSDSYKAYITPEGVKDDFGSDSLTYKMANALFTPVPNFRTGGGYLYIFPFNGVNATSASFTTPVLTSNVTAFQNVSNGDLSITIDGTDYLVTGLNFSNVKTVQDIANVIKNKNLDVNIAVVNNAIVFTSRRFGDTSGLYSQVTINTVTGGSGTDISTVEYLNAVAGTEEDGTNASGQTLADAVTNALKEVYFGGVLSTQYVEDNALLSNASAIQALDCDYFEVIPSLADISGVGASIKAAGNGKTRTLAYSLEDNKVAVATYATIAKSVNFDGSNTANTLNLKTLTGVLPDKNLNDTYVLAAKTNGVDIYGNTGGISCVYSNDNNGYTDDIENQLWFKKAIEVAGFNYLRQTNTKIPQTEAGMAGLKNAYAQICEKGIKNGVIGAGTWSTAIPFGDPDDFKRNIAEKGYYIYSEPIAEQSQVDREARKAPVVQIAIKMSGAFHSSDVIIYVER